MASPNLKLIAAPNVAVAAFPAAAWTSARSASLSQVDHDADRALAALYASSDNAREQARRALGVLVFPRIMSLLGKQEGEGVMRSVALPNSYYRIATTTRPPPTQRFSLAFFFNRQSTIDALDREGGWMIGADAPTQEVLALPFGQQGLMTGLGLDGSRITRLRIS